MKVTLLGHASVLVEMLGVNCLMDPVFADPFEEGAVTSCPKREISVERLPKIDILILSHAHLDHFDIPSLARVSRKVDVLCPKDHVITYALKELGFTKVHDTAPMTRIVHDNYELMTTHSAVTNVIEFGVVFKDKTGTFWNQVDTAAAPPTVDAILKDIGTIDLMFAMHASQNFKFFESRVTSFPAEMHAINLSTVLRAKPRLTVPGAAGFRFCGGAEWCNRFLFPMSREQFVADLAKLDPTLTTCIANPGDEFEIHRGTVDHKRGASKIARTIEVDTHHLRFDLTAGTPPLTDPNVGGYAAERIAKAVTETLDEFVAFLRREWDSGDPGIADYRRLGVNYLVGIVFPDGHEEFLRLGFGLLLEVEKLTEAVPASAVHRIAASALTAWRAREKTYFFLRAFSRKFTALYSLERADNGRVTVTPPERVGDLFEYYLNRKAPGAELALKVRIDQEIAKAKRK